MKKFAHSAARWAFLALLLLLLTSMALSARAEVVTTSSSIASPSPIQQARTRGSSADGNSNRFITRKEQRRRRHQRRAMEHYQQQRRRRHSYHYPSSYQQQQEKDSQSKNYHRTTRAPASLSDVFLCYVFALGWSVWFLSSFLNTDLMRYAQNNSVLVHGNVREVSIETDSLGTGIPTYHALIDYIITVRRERDESKIQVRKSFQTQVRYPYSISSFV